MKPFAAWLEAFVLFVIVIAAWILFAPMQLGGQSAYLIIDGNSMEPNFRLGDLVIVRQSSNYQVGDIVAYLNEDLGNYVFHRIIGQELDHFILKGDNNAWIDSFQPTTEALIGNLWIHLPQTGKVIEWIRRPINMALVAGLLGGLLMIGFVMDQSQHGKNMNKSIVNWGEIIVILTLVVGVLAIASLILGIIAFSQPIWQTVTEDIQYQQMGTFFYSAAVPPGIYDSTTLHADQPIFPKLSCSINLGFGYTVAGYQTQDFRGTYQLAVELTEDQSGWQRTFALQPMTTFSSDMFVTSATLNLCQVETLVATLEQQTGINFSYYTLAVIPNVTVMGKVSGQELLDTFNPRLIFKFDKRHFFLVRGDPQIDPLNPLKSGVLKTSRLAENTIPLLGLEPIVSEMRIFALIVFSLSLTGLLIFGLYTFRIGRHSPETLIRMKYGSMLADIQSAGVDTPAGTIIVTSMDELAKLAERYNAMILHEIHDSAHYYFVMGNGITYRYILRSGNRVHANIKKAENMESNG